MKKHFLALFIVNAILSHSTASAQNDIDNNKPNARFDSYISASLSPIPSYVLFGQFSFGFSIEKSKMESSLYFKTGVALESFFYSSFLESNYRIKRITFENQNKVDFQIPLWFAYRNYRPLARGEEHSAIDYFTMLNIGTGINIKFDLGDRISFVHKLGVGIGPKYIRAGDFQYNNFEYQKIAAFPNLDLAIVLWLKKQAP